MPDRLNFLIYRQAMPIDDKGPYQSTREVNFPNSFDEKRDWVVPKLFSKLEKMNLIDMMKRVVFAHLLEGNQTCAQTSDENNRFKNLETRDTHRNGHRSYV